jgi:hypothetical protein
MRCSLVRRFAVVLALCMSSVLFCNTGAFADGQTLACVVSGFEYSAHGEKGIFGLTGDEFLNKAVAMEQALISGWKARVVRTRYTDWPDKAALLNFLEGYAAQAGDGDVFVFYFVGHGHSDGFRLTNIGEFVLNWELAHALSACRAEKVLILDCCGSGGAIHPSPFQPFSGFKSESGTHVLASTHSAEGGCIAPVYGTVLANRVARAIRSGERSVRAVFDYAAAPPGTYVEDWFAELICAKDSSDWGGPELWPSTPSADVIIPEPGGSQEDSRVYALDVWHDCPGPGGCAGIAVPNGYIDEVHHESGHVTLYYPSGFVGTLTVSTHPGWRFSHWSGDAAGTDTTITIVMDGDKSCTAHFIRE